jgi:hypothetical protein
LLCAHPRLPAQLATAGHPAGQLRLLLLAFVCCSAWNNQQLISQTAMRLHAFQSLSVTQEPARGKAVQQLQSWQQHLSTLAADGVPLRLGFGLYQGQHLTDIVQRAIQSYHRPSPSQR